MNEIKRGLFYEPAWRWASGHMLILQILVRVLPEDVLSQETWFSRSCEFIISLMPWIHSIGRSYALFPEVATAVYCLLWVLLPIQLFVALYLFSVPGDLRDGFLASNKHPVRTSIGLIIGTCLVLYIVVFSDAIDFAQPGGWRGQIFSLMPASLGWFAFGVSFFFMGLSASVAYTIWHFTWLAKGRSAVQ